MLGQKGGVTPAASLERRRKAKGELPYGWRRTGNLTGHAVDLLRRSTVPVGGQPDDEKEHTPLGAGYIKQVMPLRWDAETGKQATAVSHERRRSYSGHGSAESGSVGAVVWDSTSGFAGGDVGQRACELPAQKTGVTSDK